MAPQKSDTCANPVQKTWPAALVLELDNMDEEALIELQIAWNNPEQKDGCIVRLDDLERDYSIHTDIRLAGRIWIPRSDIGCGRVVQRREDGVRVLQIQGGRSTQMCTNWKKGGDRGRH